MSVPFKDSVYSKHLEEQVEDLKARFARLEKPLNTGFLGRLKPVLVKTQEEKAALQHHGLDHTEIVSEKTLAGMLSWYKRILLAQNQLRQAEMEESGGETRLRRLVLRRW